MAGLPCFLYMTDCIKLLILLLMNGLSEERSSTDDWTVRRTWFVLRCLFQRQKSRMCKATTMCSLEPKDQVCGGRKYIDNRGNIRYELGCVPTQISQNPLNTHVQLYGSKELQIIDQIKCCNSDLCNEGRNMIDVTTRISKPTTIKETSLSPELSSDASDITQTTYDSSMKYSLLLFKLTTAKSTNLEKKLIDNEQNI